MLSYSVNCSSVTCCYKFAGKVLSYEISSDVSIHCVPSWTSGIEKWFVFTHKPLYPPSKDLGFLKNSEYFKHFSECILIELCKPFRGKL